MSSSTTKGGSVTVDSLLAERSPEAPSSSILELISKAQALRRDLEQRTGELDQQRADSLLSASEKELSVLEKDRDQVRRNLDRLAVLLSALQQDLQAQRGRETLRGLNVEALDVAAAREARDAWLREHAETLSDIIGKGLFLEAKAMLTHQRFVQSVDAAYRRQEVRDAGPLDASVPEPLKPLIFTMFPNWNLAK